MSRDWTEEELARASKAMKAQGHMSYEEFKEALNRSENRSTRTCPICGKTYTDHPALSRTDNKTEICPSCGTREALQAAGLEHLTDEVIAAIEQSKKNLE